MILCISHSQDYYNIDLVMRAVGSCGMEAVRMNSDTFGHESSFSFSYTDDYPVYKIRLDKGREIYTDEIRAVWNRKLWKITIPAQLDKSYEHIYEQEYLTMRNILLDSMGNIPWFNPLPAEIKVTGNKLYQLQIAARNGLAIPQTLFSNNSLEVTDFFYNNCKGGMIVKMHGTLSTSMLGNTPAFPTTKILEEHLEQLDSLIYCPMIFQEYISKEYELRVMYVDGLTFTGKIATNDTITDWRYTAAGLQWEPYTLPPAVCLQIKAMMQELGLHTGAIDLIKDRDGKYVFLEVNPSGEWGMLQKFLGYPIAETIARKLIEKIK